MLNADAMKDALLKFAPRLSAESYRASFYSTRETGAMCENQLISSYRLAEHRRQRCTQNSDRLGTSVDEKDGSGEIATIRDGADRARVTLDFGRQMSGGLCGEYSFRRLCLAYELCTHDIELIKGYHFVCFFFLARTRVCPYIRCLEGLGGGINQSFMLTVQYRHDTVFSCIT